MLVCIRGSECKWVDEFEIKFFMGMFVSFVIFILNIGWWVDKMIIEIRKEVILIGIFSILYVSILNKIWVISLGWGCWLERNFFIILFMIFCVGKKLSNRGGKILVIIFVLDGMFFCILYIKNNIYNFVIWV